MSKKEELIRYWQKSKTVKDSRLIIAFKKLPREDFLPENLKEEAYEDKPLPIGYGATISQPTTIMIMTQALDIKRGDNILEIGSGSGYQSALAAYMTGDTGKVYTTEIVPELVENAENNLKKLNIKNVSVIKTDGSKGYKEGSPYDKIIVTAACPKIPRALLNQLKENGILIAPVGSLYNQEMLKITKKKNKIETENLGNFIFVPLRGKNGFN